MTLGEWLKKEGKSQAWLAAEIDRTCTQALVSKWVRGVVLPSLNRRRWIDTLTGGKVSERGIVLRYKRTKAALRQERGNE